LSEVRNAPIVLADIANLALLILADTVQMFDAEINSFLIVTDRFACHGSQIFIEDAQQLAHDPASLVAIAQLVSISAWFQCHC
jgi:hypothetical protein